MLFREIVTGIEGVNRTVVDIVVKGHVTSCSGAGQVIEEVAQGHGGIVVDGDAEGAREGVAKEHAEFTIMYVGLRRLHGIGGCDSHHVGQSYDSLSDEPAEAGLDGKHTTAIAIAVVQLFEDVTHSFTGEYLTARTVAPTHAPTVGTMSAPKDEEIALCSGMQHLRQTASIGVAENNLAYVVHLQIGEVVIDNGILAYVIIIAERSVWRGWIIHIYLSRVLVLRRVCQVVFTDQHNVVVIVAVLTQCLIHGKYVSLMAVVGPGG